MEKELREAFQNLRSDLKDIREDHKEFQKELVKQGRDISQLKIWSWVSRSTAAAIFAAVVTWFSAKMGSSK